MITFGINSCCAFSCFTYSGMKYNSGNKMVFLLLTQSVFVWCSFRTHLISCSVSSAGGHAHHCATVSQTRRLFRWFKTQRCGNTPKIQTKTTQGWTLFLNLTWSWNWKHPSCVSSLVHELHKLKFMCKGTCEVSPLELQVTIILTVS